MKGVMWITGHTLSSLDDVVHEREQHLESV